MMHRLTTARASCLIYGFARRQAARQKSAGRWLLPGNICEAVPLALMSADAPIEFIDIDVETLALNTDRVASSLDRHGPCAGIINIHPYGSSHGAAQRLRHLRQLIGSNSLLIDDRCLCVPSLEPTESEADLVLYSTGYGKVLDLGSGGYGFARDPLNIPVPEAPHDPAAERRLVSALQTAETRGQVCPMDEDEILRRSSDHWLPNTAGPDPVEQDKHVKSNLAPVLAHKRMINAIYREHLPEQACWPDPFQSWRFQISTHDSHALLEHIRAAGFFASSHYRGFEHAFGKFDLPETRRLQSKTVNLFNDKNIAEDQALALALHVRAFLEAH
ncbi:hypothetical protein [Maricaulis sp.]|uniref:hypothetical protein n=1 Tax=Maricaulis sp. TaxID=1486257 RepID=UPI001B0BE0AB|nr:hypothetical protein [Maricaulis sp.]MBO6797758.1 hypothetical protein [Maricaulis sp.]